MTFLNEGNLYRLMIKSRKPEAAQFEAWVCDVVLPSIRKTGSYVNQPEKVETVKKELKGEITISMDKYIRLEREIVVLTSKNAELNVIVENNRALHAKQKGGLAIFHAMVKRGVEDSNEIAAATGFDLFFVDYFKKHIANKSKASATNNK